VSYELNPPSPRLRRDSLLHAARRSRRRKSTGGTPVQLEGERDTGGSLLREDAMKAKLPAPLRQASVLAGGIATECRSYEE